jgi:hypothetical protein
MARTGNKPKDSEITDNFNPDKITGEDDREMELLARQQALAEGGEVSEEEVAEAYKMLQDMRWVYRMVNGREKLKKLVEGNDRQFVAMVKELLKIESAIMTAKIRTKEERLGEGQKTVLVILKGLEEEKKYIDVTPTDVDTRQIAQMLNPEDV